MRYIEFEAMSENEYQAAMQAQTFLQDGTRQMGFWRKVMIVLWMLLVVLTMLEVAGIAPATSANAFWCGVMGIVLMPIIGIVDYCRYRKEW